MCQKVALETNTCLYQRRIFFLENKIFSKDGLSHAITGTHDNIFEDELSHWRHVFPVNGYKSGQIVGPDIAIVPLPLLLTFNVFYPDCHWQSLCTFAWISNAFISQFAQFNMVIFSVKAQHLSYLLSGRCIDHIKDHSGCVAPHVN